MRVLGHRVSKQVQQRYADDQVVAATYEDKIQAAGELEGKLRDAQAERAGDAEVRELGTDFERALMAALVAAEAAERVAMGTKCYVDPSASPKARRTAELAARKARAKPAVRPWAEEVERLRTAREAHKLTGMLPAPVRQAI